MTDAPTFANPDDMDYGVGRPFTLAGRRVSDGKPWSEEYHLTATIPQGAVADLSAAITIKDGTLHYGSLPCIRFIKQALIPDDEERFDALVRDKDRPLHIDVLGGVMLWATGQVTDRPTGPLPSSQPGERPAVDGSEEDGSSPDTEAPTLIASTLPSTST